MHQGHGTPADMSRGRERRTVIAGETRRRLQARRRGRVSVWGGVASPDRGRLNQRGIPTARAGSQRSKPAAPEIISLRLRELSTFSHSLHDFCTEGLEVGCLWARLCPYELAPIGSADRGGAGEFQPDPLPSPWEP